MSGVFFRDQAIALSKYGGHLVTVLVINLHTLKKIRTKGLFSYRVENDEEIKVHTFSIVKLFPEKYLLNSYIRKYLIKCFILKIEKIQKKKIDVIHAHSFSCAGYDIALLKDKRIKLVVTEHRSSIGNNQLSASDEKKLTYTVNNVDSFVCVSQSLADIVKKHTLTTRNIYVIPNILADGFVYDKNIIKYDDFTFCAAGNLVEIKQYDVMIYSFVNAFGAGEKVKLLICGEGVERKNIEELIKKNNRCHQIQLLGLLPHDKVKEVMQKSHAFLHTSRSETFGVVMIEALACGLPVVGTLSGGSDDILKSYGAFCAKVGDVNGISLLMKRLKSTYNDLDLYKISSSAISKYGASSISKQLTQLYKSL